MVSTNSASLLGMNRVNYGEVDESTSSAIGQKASGATYEMYFTVWVQNPEWSSIIGPRSALPLFAPLLTDDPTITLEANSLAGIGLNNSSTAVTITACEIMFKYGEMPAGTEYVPTELITITQPWQGSGQLTFDFPQNGYLLWYFHEEFTSATARGFMQPSTGRWRLNYGRQLLREYSSQFRNAENGLNKRRYPSGWSAVNALLTSPNDVGMTITDLFHNLPLGDAVSLASALNLYSANKGDRVQLLGTNIPSGGISLLTTYKALIDDPTILNGV
jgi:hypothetical protein